jgi:hypothetical protein
MSSFAGPGGWGGTGRSEGSTNLAFSDLTCIRSKPNFEFDSERFLCSCLFVVIWPEKRLRHLCQQFCLEIMPLFSGSSTSLPTACQQPTKVAFQPHTSGEHI